MCVSVSVRVGVGWESTRFLTPAEPGWQREAKLDAAMAPTPKSGTLRGGPRADSAALSV